MAAKVIACILLGVALCSANEIVDQEKTDGRLFFTGDSNQSVTIGTDTLSTVGLLLIAGLLLGAVLALLSGGDDASSGYAASATGSYAPSASSYAVHRSLEAAEEKYR